eukprot:2110132-Rhodomonas_salina.1
MCGQLPGIACTADGKRLEFTGTTMKTLMSWTSVSARSVSVTACLNVFTTFATLAFSVSLSKFPSWTGSKKNRTSSTSSLSSTFGDKTRACACALAEQRWSSITFMQEFAVRAPGVRDALSSERWKTRRCSERARQGESGGSG